MSIKYPNKSEIITEYQIKEKDTGSPEVQVAILTDKIRKLTEHLKLHKKDFQTKRGLLMMVGRRRRLLKYVAKQDIDRYRSLIKRLDLRH